MASHRREDGTFRNPWLEVEPGKGAKDFWRWQLERLRERARLPRRRDARVPVTMPTFPTPRAKPHLATATWIGQSSWLLQLGGLNILTDPVFAPRASPFSWAGPRRLHPPGVPLEALPPIDAVLLSHDHYDHLDEPSVRAIHARFGYHVQWLVPLGFAPWFAKLGMHRVVELDWWERASLLTEDGGSVDVTATPAQHWCRRGPGDANRLWCSFVLRVASDEDDGGAAGDTASAIYFAGDSGYCTVFREIGEKLGPFDLTLMPIGAYEPRWFMQAAHMNPEEAVQAYLDLGGRGGFAGMHWGTFILTDEPVNEPPERTRAAWEAHGLPEADLRIPAIGETLTI